VTRGWAGGGAGSTRRRGMRRHSKPGPGGGQGPVL
jgi:hypothetical protein